MKEQFLVTVDADEVERWGTMDSLRVALEHMRGVVSVEPQPQALRDEVRREMVRRIKDALKDEEPKP